MFTAGVRPAFAVRATCSRNAVHATSPFVSNGSKIADMPTIARRGRSIAMGSITSVIGELAGNRTALRGSRYATPLFPAGADHVGLPDPLWLCRRAAEQQTGPDRRRERD